MALAMVEALYSFHSGSFSGIAQEKSSPETFNFITHTKKLSVFNVLGAVIIYVIPSLIFHSKATNICFAIAIESNGGTALPISNLFIPSEP